MPRAAGRVALVAAMFAVTVSVWAQEQTTTKETKKFEVIAVDGNNLVVKLPEGTRELTVPEDFRFTVDGQQLSVHELKPGMSGTATITTKTTSHPVTVTEVKNGTVRQVTGSSILVQTDQGFKNFTQGDVDKRGVKIIKDGKPAQISDFSTGDKLTATIVTSRPPRTVTEKQVDATLARAAGSGAAAANAAGSTGAKAAGSAAAATSPADATAGTAGAAAPAPRKLPKTASNVPLLGFIGIGLVVFGAALTLRRRGLIG
jgi:LPXTG-motif cell wall-anchored protein